MTNAKDEEPPSRRLVLDDIGQRLEQFRLFRADEAQTDQILEEFGGRGKVESDMVLELSATRVLGHPERFAEANALAMHALEVLDRNGARPPSGINVGPLTPIAKFFVQQVVRFIVRTHQGRLIDAVRNLYARRLAWCPADDPSRHMLIRARLDADRATPAYKKSAGGLPTFLVGGAAVSSLGRVLGGSLGGAFGSRVGRVAAVVVTFLLLAAVSWIILRGAGIARRRIRVTTDAPIEALWQAVGRCGTPPKDQARMFAVIGIVLTAVGWLLIPLIAVAATVL